MEFASPPDLWYSHGYGWHVQILFDQAEYGFSATGSGVSTIWLLT